MLVSFVWLSAPFRGQHRLHQLSPTSHEGRLGFRRRAPPAAAEACLPAMEVAAPPAVVAAVLNQLVARNAVESAAWAEATSDYLAALQHNRELQARQSLGAAPVASTHRAASRVARGAAAAVARRCCCHGDPTPSASSAACRCATRSWTRRPASYGPRTRRCCGRPRTPNTALCRAHRCGGGGGGGSTLPPCEELHRLQIAARCPEALLPASAPPLATVCRSGGARAAASRRPHGSLQRKGGAGGAEPAGHAPAAGGARHHRAAGPRAGRRSRRGAAPARAGGLHSGLAVLGAWIPGQPSAIEKGSWSRVPVSELVRRRDPTPAGPDRWPRRSAPASLAQVRELRGQVDHYRQAHATVSKEMEVGWMGWGGRG